ncbi:hypothetical protein Taro_040766 [Colocasia esculenta]|uniref:Uncharacterized protein n=1 Tax=Colocasia esculenta TaxID=4460 RepID=A0A843WMU6_COLES|nr:hypothetical protein [Colocasia esculenta]
MQTQAQALALVPQEHGHGGPSIMERFKRMALPPFKGESMVATRKCIPSLPVCIEDRGLFGCFYLLKMKDYDAILGLD